jgi:pimeloyl-ACP methyl ester carboxylesterase
MAEILANGLRTHVQRLGGPRPEGTPQGEGAPPVVFVHGIVVDNLSSLYFTVAPQVSQRRRAVLYDLRGHGKTERPPGGYRLDDLHDDLAGVLDAEVGRGPAILLGHSYGGLIALSFALRFPARVAALALVDPPLPVAGWGPEIAAIFGLRGEERDRRIRDAYDTMHGARETRKRRRLAAVANALVGETSLLDDMRQSRVFSDREIAALACPTLAIYGDQSEILAAAERLARLVPHAQVEILPGCTHLVLFEATEQVRGLILDWLERLG